MEKVKKRALYGRMNGMKRVERSGQERAEMSGRQERISSKSDFPSRFEPPIDQQGGPAQATSTWFANGFARLNTYFFWLTHSLSPSVIATDTHSSILCLAAVKSVECSHHLSSESADHHHRLLWRLHRSSKMQRSDDETRPLLGTTQHEAVNLSSSPPTPPKPDRSLIRFLRGFQHQWPILRILAVALVYGAGFYGAAPSYLDGLRGFTCSYHYSTPPDLLPSDPHGQLPRDRDRPCAVAGVESKVGIIVAVATMLSFVVSSASMLFYGPKLSKWGRKPLLIISLFSNMINYIPFALLPLGYPLGPVPSELAIPPAVSLALILFCSFLAGLTGFTALVLCVLRAMIVDVASPTRRTLALNWLVTATLCGAFLGPLLAAWTLDTSVRARTSVAFEALFQPSIGILELPSDPMTPPPIPGTPQAPSKHGNPAALVACCWLFSLAIIWTLLLVPETKPTTIAPTNPVDANMEAAAQSGISFAGTEFSSTTLISSSISPARLRAGKVLGPLSIYLPQVARDGSKDYRLTWLALAGAFANVGTSALSYVAVFAGYRFDFTPDAIGLLLGLIGASRAAWLIFAIPLLVVLLERTIRKPVEIVGLSVGELGTLAKAGLKDPDLTQPNSTRDGELGDRGIAQSPETSHDQGSEAETIGPKDTIRAAVLWRVSIDIAIAKVSYFADIIGYLVVFLSASFSNAATMIFGTLFLSFGAGAGPAVASAAIAIIQDLKRQEYPTLHSSLHPNPTDDWLAALSISDNVVNGFSPILISVVYSLTIETGLPSACFLIPTVGYILSLGLLVMVKTRDLPSVGDSQRVERSEAESHQVDADEIPSVPSAQ